MAPIDLAALFADRHCGEGTKLILYMNPGELFSRTFTSKDTHSTAGDLLVVYAEVRRSTHQFSHPNSARNGAASEGCDAAPRAFAVHTCTRMYLQGTLGCGPLSSRSALCSKAEHDDKRDLSLPEEFVPPSQLGGSR